MHRHIYSFLVLIFVVINVNFILDVTSGIPLADEWRWIKELLIPLLDGDMSWSQYLVGEYALLSHSHYAALSFLWLDYQLFDLDLRYFTYIGIVFYVLGSLILFVVMRHIMTGDWKVDLPAVLIASVGYFCVSSDFSWLLVVFEYFYFFLALGLLIGADFFLKGKIHLARFMVLTLVCLVLGDTIGMAAVFVCMIALLVACVIDRVRIKQFVIYIAVIAIFFILQYLLLGKGIGSGAHSRVETIAAIVDNPTDVIISFFTIFSVPLIDINVFKYISGERNAPVLQFGFGVASFLFIASIYLMYFYYQGWRKSYLPLLFITYSLLSWLLIFISRYLNYGVDVMDEPRYVRLFTLIYVGAGVALFCININTPKLYQRFIGFSAVILVFIYTNTVIYRYWYSQFVETYNANLMVEIKKEPVDNKALSSFLWRCDDGYCQASIDFMRLNKLGPFKD